MIQFKKLNSKRLVVQRFLFTFLILFNININASDINQSILLKEISLLKEENKNLKVKIENVEWKREESVSNINDRIESFGNFLEVANNKREEEINFFAILITVLVTLFGILMTLLVIFFALKSTKEAKNLAEDWLEKEAKNHINKTKEAIDSYMLSIKKDKEQIEFFVEEYKTLIEDDDIELSIENKEILEQEIKIIKMKALMQRTFQDNLKIIFYHIAYKNYQEAEKHIDSLVLQYSSDFELSRLYYLRGVIADKQNKKDETIKYYEAAIVKSKNYSDPYRQLAHFYSSVEKDYLKAIDLFQKAIQINPYDYRAYARIGVAYRRNNDIKEAKKSYKEAIKINPDSRIAYNNLGFLYLLENDIETAIENFKHAIRVDPDSSIASYNNIFRVQLMSTGKIDQNLEEEYLIKFEDKGLDHFSSYELYKILFKVIEGEEISNDLESWKFRYSDSKFRQFSINELKKWAIEYKDKSISKKLVAVIASIEQYYI